MGNENTKTKSSPEIIIYCTGWIIDKNTFHEWLEQKKPNINYDKLCTQCWCVNNNKIINHLLPIEYVIIESINGQYILIYNKYNTQHTSSFQFDPYTATYTKNMATLWNATTDLPQPLKVKLINIKYLF